MSSSLFFVKIVKLIQIYFSSFVVDRPDANYMAVSSNIAIQETRGGPDKYELYMKFGKPPTTIDYDLRSTLTSSDSYVGDVLYR